MASLHGSDLWALLERDDLGPEDLTLLREALTMVERLMAAAAVLAERTDWRRAAQVAGGPGCDGGAAVQLALQPAEGQVP